MKNKIKEKRTKTGNYLNLELDYLASVAFLLISVVILITGAKRRYNINQV